MTHQFEVGKWYKTRGGFDAQVLDVNYNGHVWYRIIGEIKVDGRERNIVWMIDGAHCGDGTTHEYDLLPPVERKEFWVNVEVASDRYMLLSAWHSRDHADNNITGDHFGMIRIVIEGDDFTVEKVTG